MGLNEIINHRNDVENRDMEVVDINAVTHRSVNNLVLAIHHKWVLFEYTQGETEI